MDKQEAIKILKEFHDTSALFSVRTALETVFPELKESEDERIRQELITHCRNTRCVTEEGAEGIAKWIAWLEKQGEKSINQYDIEIPFGAKDSELIEESYYIPKGYHAEICKDKVTIKKGEQEPTWSEKDEVGLCDALWAIKQARTIAKDESDMGNLWYAENWLKSLKQRIGG